MASITIIHENSSNVLVKCDNEGVAQELVDMFTFQQPGFHKNRWTKWDGTVRLYNKASCKLPHGLWMNVAVYAKKQGYTLDIDPILMKKIDLDDKEFDEWVADMKLSSKGEDITPHDYQSEIVKDFIKHRRVTALAATSAGKSLSIYLCVRYALMNIEDDEKILILVPSINLVNQLYADFEDYSKKDKDFDTNLFVHKIFGGQDKYTRKPVIISTWQSMANIESNEYFECFNSIIVDECHTADAKQITAVVSKCRNAQHRLGLTGTLKSNKVSHLQVQGLFGAVRRYVTAKELIDEGKATKVIVNMIELQYPTRECFDLKDAAYTTEIEYILQHEKRKKAILGLATTLKGNSLFLFDRIEGHLEVIRQALEERGINYRVICGGVGREEREEIRQGMEDEENCILLGSYGTMSTGISVRRLHNVVFCHPSKSVVRVLQSLGRGMRLHDTKEVCNLYDIVDNLKFDKSWNHCMRHASERYGYYASEKHPIKIKKIKLTE